MSQRSQKNSEFRHDVLILGSGAAGLSLALKLATHLSVAVLSKKTITEGSTFYAQGGIFGVARIEQRQLDLLVFE